MLDIAGSPLPLNGKPRLGTWTLLASQQLGRMLISEPPPAAGVMLCTGQLSCFQSLLSTTSIWLWLVNEAYWASVVLNPVDVTSTPGGEPALCASCARCPLTNNCWPPFWASAADRGARQTFRALSYSVKPVTLSAPLMTGCWPGAACQTTRCPSLPESAGPSVSPPGTWYVPPARSTSMSPVMWRSRCSTAALAAEMPHGATNVQAVP